MAQMAFSFDMFGGEDTIVAPVAPIATRHESAPAVLLPEVAPVWQPLALAAPATPTAHNPRFVLDPQVAELPGGRERKYEANLQAIRLLDRLDSEGREATEEERIILARYSGWGALPHAFVGEESHPWFPRAAELKKLLGPRLDAARASTPNAHYTPTGVIDAVWQAVSRLGFAGGRILEPSAGTGRFIGRMPAALRASSQVVAVELEPITASILRRVYPEIDVRASGFERVKVPAGSFDLAIGNVPFGDYQVFDPDYDQHRAHIHNYFFLKCADLVRPGGLLALITSMGTLDSHNGKHRELLARTCDLVAAFRLPSGVFSASAECDVGADLLFLKVRKEPREEPPDWASIQRWSGSSDYAPLYWNSHFHANPEFALGRPEQGKSPYGHSRVIQVRTEGDFASRLDRAIASLPENAFEPAEPSRRLEPLTFTQRVAEGELQRDETGAIVRIVDGEPKRITGQYAARVTALYGLYETLSRLLARQGSPTASDEDCEGLRGVLNAQYDRFVATYGYLSKRVNIHAARDWSRLPLILSLEHWDDEKGVGRKAAIFSQRTTGVARAPERADNLADAVTISFAESLQVDVPRIAELLGREEGAVEAELEGEQLAYFDPVEGRWMLAEEFLSGDVRNRLALIEPHARTNARFTKHCEALRTVLPAFLKHDQIMVQLGCPWVPIDVIEAFVKLICDVQYATVTRSRATAIWSVSAYASQASHAQHGYEDYPPPTLIEKSLNGQRVKIWDEFPDGTRVVNPVKTAGAREKQERLEAMFIEWVWEDESRRTRLVDIYNTQFNSVVPRKFDGSWLRLPDLSRHVSLRWSQKSAVARALLAGNAGIFHKTGAGKTMIGAVIAHESRRLGLARKSMIVVQNSTLYQSAAEYFRLYPGANILVVDRDALSGMRRKVALAKIATGDWEAIIVSHSTLDRLPMGEAAVDRVCSVLTEPIRRELATVDARDVKPLEKALKRLQTLLSRLTHRSDQDKHLTFEDLNVDKLIVDEAQRFKNLAFATRRERVAGMQQAASRRALDLYAKAIWLRELHGRPDGLVMMTATPITNTLAEIFTMQRYLQPQVLEEHGLDSFDAWAAMFGQVVAAVEVSPTGRGFRVHERFSRFHNVPEMLRLFLRACDIKQKVHLEGVLKEPNVIGGAPEVIAAKCHEQLRAFIDTLVERAARLKQEKVDPREDNMLKIVHEGRCAALDMRTLFPDAEDFPGSKVNLAVEDIYKIWERTSGARLTQLVFCDLSVPHADGRWNVYADMRAKLLARGVPADEIAFAQDHESDAQRAALFKAVRQGRKRIVFGSTERLGTGANVQDLVIAMHNLDVPWRPADLEQRDGRGIRDGNRNEEIHVKRFITESSFDAYMWQTAETKAKFILQAMDPDMKLRSVEDLTVATLSYAEVKAAACGDPEVIERIKIEAELAKLDLLYRSHESQRRVKRHELSYSKGSLEDYAVRTEKLQRFVSEWDSGGVPGAVEMFGKGADAGEVYASLVEQTKPAEYGSTTVPVGTFGEYKLFLHMGRDVELGAERDQVNVHLGGPRTARGFLQALQAFGTFLTEELERARRRRLDRENAVKALEAELTGRWEHEERFERLRARLSELDVKFAIGKSEANVAALEGSSEEPEEAPENEEGEGEAEAEAVAD